MTEGFLESRGIAYRVSTLQPERKTLLLVHGLSGSASAWFPYEKRFENVYNIVSIDLRGHGKSKRWARLEDYDISKFSEDIAELLKHLRVEKYVLISHSLGALVALEFLRMNQKQVSAAIFLSPVYGIRGKALARVVFLLLTRVGTKLVTLLPFFPNVQGRIDYSQHQNTWDWNLRRIVADVSNTTLRVYLYCLREIWRHDSDKKWKELRLPTLLIHGKKDTIVPFQNAIQLSKEIPNSKLILLENANHILVLNNVPEVSIAIENFITNIPTSSSM